MCINSVQPIDIDQTWFRHEIFVYSYLTSTQFDLIAGGGL